MLPPARCLGWQHWIRPGAGLEPILDTVRLVRADLQPKGTPDRADRLCRRAIYRGLLHGGGRRIEDFAATRAMAYREPALFDRLIDS